MALNKNGKGGGAHFIEILKINGVDNLSITNLLCRTDSIQNKISLVEVIQVVSFVPDIQIQGILGRQKLHRVF